MESMNKNQSTAINIHEKKSKKAYKQINKLNEES